MSYPVRYTHRDAAVEGAVRAEKLRRAHHSADDRGVVAGPYGRLPGSRPRLFKWLARITH